MRALLTTAIIGAASVASTNAHAMGVYITTDVVAWSSDGNAVLLHQHHSSSGTAGRVESYLIVTASSNKTQYVSFDDSEDPDTTKQHISATDCTKAAADFAKKLAAVHIDGIKLDAAQCKTASRAVLSVDATAAIVTPQKHDAMDRQFLAAPNDGDLLIELWGENGDSSTPAHARVFIVSGDGYKQLIEDLRYRP